MKKIKEFFVKLVAFVLLISPILIMTGMFALVSKSCTDTARDNLRDSAHEKTKVD